MPDEATAADALFIILAIQLGRCPRYNHRVKSPRTIKAAVPSLQRHAAEKLAHPCSRNQLQRTVIQPALSRFSRFRLLLGVDLSSLDLRVSLRIPIASTIPPVTPPPDPRKVSNRQRVFTTRLTGVRKRISVYFFVAIALCASASLAMDALLTKAFFVLTLSASLIVETSLPSVLQA
jgi:hypothetical protein